MKITYTAEQRRTAVAKYRRLGSYTKTVRVLGYPSLHTLHEWVRNTKPGGNPRATPRPPRHYSWKFKLAAVQRVLAGEDVKHVAEERFMNTHVTLYSWVQLWREHGDYGLMNKREKAQADGFPTRASLERTLPDDPNELKRIAADLMVEKAVLQRELELVKKDEGVIPDQLSNLNKTRLVQTLRPQFPLGMLLKQVGLKASSYYHCVGVLLRPQSHALLRVKIRDIAKDSMHTYGSPRVWMSLRREGIRVSEKVVRRLMKEEQIPVFYARRKRQYSSYEGEVSPAPVDLVERVFRAPEPDQVWVTDVTEFAAPDAKVYFSPMIDCFDGKIVAWRMARRPTKHLTQGMLEDAIATLSDDRKAALHSEDGAPLLRVHSDRGGHYRGSEWVETMKISALSRSMGRKGKSGDNAACEGFFGRMKSEMFYDRAWANAAQIEAAIKEYTRFYNDDRIKMTLGGVTIREYRETRDTKLSKK